MYFLLKKLFHVKLNLNKTIKKKKKRFFVHYSISLNYNAKKFLSHPFIYLIHFLMKKNILKKKKKKELVSCKIYAL